MTEDGAGVSLRRLRLDDIERVREWRNLPHVARYMYTDHEISEAEHARWFDDALERPDRQHWIIELDGEPVGLASLVDISDQHRRASSASYLADPSMRGRGLGSFAESFLLDQAFGVLKLHKVCCEVFRSNEAGVAMHRKLGFTIDGVLREHIWKGDHFEDVVSMSITADEYHGLTDVTIAGGSG